MWRATYQIPLGIFFDDIRWVRPAIRADLANIQVRKYRLAVFGLI
jgi:hypothetical protein